MVKYFNLNFLLFSFLLFQIDGILYFEGREALPQWDKQIQSLCFQVNTIIECIHSAYPEWVTKVIDEQMVQWVHRMWLYLDNLHKFIQS